jgi:LacI family transcriptional regulator
MIVMDIANPFFTDMIRGAEDYVEEPGFSLQLGNSAGQPTRETAHLNVFEQQRVRGVLLTPNGAVSDELAQLRRRGIPVVVVDRATEDRDYCSVSVDDVEGGRLAVNHLLGQGHRRIAFVGDRSGLEQVRDRRLGAEKAVGFSRSGSPELLII